jgi:hypothetical protein
MSKSGNLLMICSEDEELIYSTATLRNLNANVKVKLFLRLINYDAIKTYGGVDV